MFLQVCNTTGDPASCALLTYRTASSSSISASLTCTRVGGNPFRFPNTGDTLGWLGLIRLLIKELHWSIHLGTRLSLPNSGPSKWSVAILVFMLGLVKVPSVDGDNTTTASGARNPSSRIHAISDRARLAPAESPEMNSCFGKLISLGPLSCSHRAITTHYARLIGGAVFALDYRLMPEHTRQAGIDDCRAAWRWLQDNGPREINFPKQLFISGDSAGANLALSLIAWIRDEGLRAPDAVVVLSPPTDCTFTSPSMKTNMATDHLLGPLFGKNERGLDETKISKGKTITSKTIPELHNQKQLQGQFVKTISRYARTFTAGCGWESQQALDSIHEIISRFRG